MKNNIRIPIYSIIFLVVVLVGTNILNKYYFNLFDQTIAFGVLSIGFSYFFSNQINRKSNIFLTVLSFVIALLIQVAIFMIMQFLTNEIVVWLNAFAYLLAIGISNIVNVILYSLIIKKKHTFLSIFILYMFASFLYELVLFIVVDKAIITGMESYLLIVNLIHLIIAIVLALIERYLCCFDTN